MNTLEEARRVFSIEIEALQKMMKEVSIEFSQIIDYIVHCEGKVVVSGMGKSGHIASKIAATMASLGTSSFYMHPAEALHGDLGMLTDKDVVILISYSGESEEIIRLLPNIKLIGARTVAITGNETSTLAKYCDIVQVLPNITEACYMNLAPTSSTTVSLVYGDALAVVAARVNGFTEENFGLFHPAGALGKKLLLKVSDLMAPKQQGGWVYYGSYIKDAIMELSHTTVGIVTIIDESNKIEGVITDGDLRRALKKEIDIYGLHINDLMTRTPVVVKAGEMAITALQILKQKHISAMPVINNNGEMVGTISLQLLLNAGLIA